MRQLFYGHGATRAAAAEGSLGVAAADNMPKTAAQALYRKFDALLDEHGFDAFVEGLCEKFYAPTMGRP